MIISPSNHENTIICKLNKLNEYIVVDIIFACIYIYWLDLVHAARFVLFSQPVILDAACDDEPGRILLLMKQNTWDACKDMR